MIVNNLQKSVNYRALSGLPRFIEFKRPSSKYYGSTL